MAFVIENGTGVNGADSFITLAEFTALATAYFDSPAAAKEPPIRRAWLYMKSLNWKAKLAYPTFGGLIPNDIKIAQAILAQFEAGNPNGLQPSVVPGQQKVLNRAGEIGWRVTGQTSTDAQRAAVTMAQDMLKPYLTKRGNLLSRA